ncbi:ankyrin [Aaosphaeria arxii CBS 175.79]|uniref:Ankyrin n=1 Tax=Aaosphaeria arxii CBS 175.79 TaxID=1450172 RepID=A0A6A5X6N2_9PLEO|nr:ankyrin [Aaosphaeria arxii CBS 175.79]KAF2008665.1 ankyrin [Aaosphaeria arxii CBS 175.79]
MEIRKADVDFGDEQYRDLLFYTLDANQPNIVKKLLENENIDINLPNRYGTTPLLQAKSQGHHDSVKHLLDTGRLREDSQTLLMIAVSIGSEEHVSLLLDRDDIDIDAEDTDGQTALTLAAKYGFKEIVECLLDKGNADVETTDRWRWSPLWTAAMSMHHDIVDAIFERLKERRGSDLEKERELTTLLSKVGLSSMIPHRERTPLWWAVLNGHDRIVDLLVRVGKVDLQGEDTSGRSLLLWLAGNGCSAAAFNAQLDLNSKEDAKDSRPSRTGEMIRIAETSLRNVRRQRFSTRSPVMQQVSAGHQAILEMLLATSLCNVNARDEFGRTPLCIAALNGNTAMTRILLNVDGVDVDARDGFQITPFLHAVSTGSCAVVRLLVKTRKVDLESHHTGLATARQLTRRKAMIKLLDNCALVY